MLKKALIYCRVSSRTQVQGDSLENQEEQCQRAVRLNHYPTVPPEDIYKDAFSGRRDSRPAWDALMQHCQQHSKNIGAVFIYRIDRFSRAGAFSYESLRIELERYGICLLDAEGIIQASQNAFEDLGFSYEWSNYRPSSVNEMIRAEQGRDEVRSILTRTIGAQIRLAQRGYWNRQAPYGYKTSKTIDDYGRKRTVLVPLEEEACHIREMFRDASSRIG